MARPLINQMVCKTRRVDRISIASATDFVTERDPRPVPDEGLLPYCLDFVRARAVYVAGIDRDAAQAAPFYYLHLRREARRLISVPIEHGRLSASAANDPIFLFSPGRCGSTLLSRVLYEAGIPSVSEPDFYAQMASHFWSSQLNPARAPFLDAMWNLSADLCAALGGTPVVKLRAECAKAPHMFIRGEGAKSLVLFRDFEDWARSTARIFGAGPRKAVGKYMTALRCYARLRRTSRCHAMQYEDWLADPAGSAGALGRFLGVTIPLEAVQRARAADSQEGTPLDGRVRPGWEADFNAALRLWHTPRLVSARRSLQIPNVWDWR